MLQSGGGCFSSTNLDSDCVAEAGVIARFSEPVRAWFTSAFPDGPTPVQVLAWPGIAAGEHMLLVSPTGTGKTLAAFLAILDRLFRAHQAGRLTPGVVISTWGGSSRSLRRS
jgi:ATP-dependent Lhr-like helicase